MSARRVVFGDWQTPDPLAQEVAALVARTGGVPPSSVIEPTCGTGAFLRAARARFPDAVVRGYEINPEHAAVARASLRGADAEVRVADFFTVDWQRELASLPAPTLVIGNPPWVTNAGIGSLGASNLPDKSNFKHLAGLDALTGKSNFDVSEWMLVHLLEVLQGRDATIAVLCKTTVARRMIEYAARRHRAMTVRGIWRIDAMAHFDAAVDACAFVVEPRGRPARASVYARLGAERPEHEIGMADGVLVADLAAWERTRHLRGRCEPEWRSGMKHDCADVMELSRHDGRWVNGSGEVVEIEREHCLPLLKSSDVARGNVSPRRAVVVPQRQLGEDTARLKETAPATWAYLNAHRDALAARKSSIYRTQPSFAIFGVGPYSFAPWKVATSGLYKRLAFTLVGPVDGLPVMLDDTCYFLPFDTEDEARRALAVLSSPDVLAFFSAQVFWDAKRPIQKSLLQSLDLARMLRGQEVMRDAASRVQLALFP